MDDRHDKIPSVGDYPRLARLDELNVSIRVVKVVPHPEAPEVDG